ncbi:unnamed protein product [Closterium sp. NIES-54]
MSCLLRTSHLTNRFPFTISSPTALPHSPPPPLFLAPSPPPVVPFPPHGPALSGVSQVDPLPLAEHIEVTVDSGAPRGGGARGAASEGAEPPGVEPGGAEPASAEPGGAEPEGAKPGGAETEGAEPGGAECEGAESGGAEPRGTASAGGPLGSSPRQSCRREPLSLRQLREWFARRIRLRSGAAAGGTGAGGAGATSPGGDGVSARAGGTGGAIGPGCARTRGTGAAGAGGVGGAGAGGTRSGDPGGGGAGAGGAGVERARAGSARGGDPGVGGAGAGGAGGGGIGAGGTVQRRPFFVPPPPSFLPPPGSVLRRVLSLSSSTSLTPRLLCLPPHQSQPQLLLESPLSALWSTIRTGRPVPRPRPPPDPGTYIMTLCPSSVPLRVPLPSPLASSLADGPNPKFDLLLDFAAACRLDYAASLVAESEFDCPPSVEGECALSTDVLKDRQEVFECLAATIPHLVAMLLAPEGDPNTPDIQTPRSYVEAITGPYSSHWQTAMDAEMAS